MHSSMLDWIDERTGIRGVMAAFLNRTAPRGVNWFHVLGSATLLTLVVQVVTGMVLTLYYVPSPDQAFESVEYISNEVLFGGFLRGLHHWAASAMIFLMFIHLLRVLFFGAFKYPRELNWLIGVGLLFVGLAFGLTGYLLPWDQRAYWGAVVSTEVAGTVPLIGAWILQAARGGMEVGAVTLTRFFSLHVMFLPVAIAALVGAHLFLVIRQGIAAPPERGVEVPTDPDSYQAFYNERKKEGPTFYPYVIFKDTVAFLVVFVILVALALVVGIKPEIKADPTATNFVGRPEWYFLFLFRFLSLLKPEWEILGTTVFPLLGALVLILWPFLDRTRYRHPLDRPVAAGLASLGVIGLVYLTIGGALAPQPVPAEVTRLEIQRLTPVQEEGRTIYREWACAVCHATDGVGGTRGPDLAGVGNRLKPEDLIAHLQPAPGSSLMPNYTIDDRDLIALVSYMLSLTQPPTHPLPATTPVPENEALYVASGCPACHTLNGVGGALGPDLSSVGAQRDASWLVQYLKDPKVVLPNSRMPAHPLDEEELQAIAEYLAANSAAAAAGPSPELGKEIYDSQGCSVCHVVEGAGGTLGGDLTRVGDTRDADFVIQYIRDPKSANAQSNMPPYANLTEAQLRSVAMYLLSLVGKAPAQTSSGVATTAPAQATAPAVDTSAAASPSAGSPAAEASATPIAATPIAATPIATTPVTPTAATPTQGSAATRQPTAAAAPSPSAPAAAAGDAATLYAANCAMCHGAKGEGGPIAKEPINSAEFLASRTDADVRAIIEQGKGTMPSYSGRLSPAELDALVAFIRGWQQTP